MLLPVFDTWENDIFLNSYTQRTGENMRSQAFKCILSILSVKHIAFGKQTKIRSPFQITWKMQLPAFISMFQCVKCVCFPVATTSFNDSMNVTDGNVSLLNQYSQSKPLKTKHHLRFHSMKSTF